MIPEKSLTTGNVYLAKLSNSRKALLVEVRFDGFAPIRAGYGLQRRLLVTVLLTGSQVTVRRSQLQWLEKPIWTGTGPAANQDRLTHKA